MLSKNQVRFINGLKRKKKRLSEGLFLAEGEKVVNEFLMAGFEAQQIYATPDYLTDQSGFIELIQEVTESELKSISSFSSPNQVLAIFKVPEEKNVSTSGLTLALDGVNDPGNLGTIIRLCDWFGVQHLVCSKDTVDCYNPKVVQSSMGSLTRVQVNYLDLNSFLKLDKRPVYGTFMDGESVYKKSIPDQAIIVLGNEANGISPEIEQLITSRIGIPRYGSIQKTESLNVAMATAIFLSEFRR